MSDLEPILASLVRAHAPAATSHAVDVLDASLELRVALGFDPLRWPSWPSSLRMPFGTVDLADLGRCRTVGDLQALLAARGA